MKVRSFFNLIVDGTDLLDLFTDVQTDEQLVSRLERLKRISIEASKKQEPSDLLLCVEGLRSSVSAALDDSLEMSSASREDFDDELDKEIDDIVKESENLNSEEESTEAEKENSDVQETG